MAKDTKKTDDKKAAKEAALDGEFDLEKHATDERSVPDPAKGFEGIAFTKAALAAQDTYQSVVGLLTADVDDEVSDLQDEFAHVASFLREFADVPPAAIPIELKRQGIGDESLHADDRKSLMAWEAFATVFRMAYKLILEESAPQPAPQTGQPEPIPMRARGKIRPEAYAVTGYRAKR